MTFCRPPSSTPTSVQVLPLAPEFVRNSDADGGNYRKQDCEITAGYRMLARLRADYPRMAAIIVADSLTPSNRSSSR